MGHVNRHLDAGVAWKADGPAGWLSVPEIIYL